MQRKVRLFSFGVWVTVILCAPIFVSAATIFVNSSTGNDTTGDGSSGTPYKTFHKGYTVAAASGDTLDLTGIFDWSSSDETGDASASGYTLAKSMTIQGQSAASTIIQASSTENTADRRVFTVSSGKTVTIKNVTLRYGVTTASESGGGIKNSGTLTIQNTTISNNRCNAGTNYYCGAAIDLPNDANSTLNISTSTISSNTYNGKYYGSGGIFAGQSNTITIVASTFSGNSAVSTNPTDFAYSYAEPSGAIGVFRFVTTKITNSTFSGNSTNSYGGALQIYYPNSYTITNSTIANNTASAGAGGILFESVTNGYNLIIKNTILANNTGGGTGNDFYVVSGSDGRITDNGYNIVENSTNKTWSATGDLIGDQANLNLASTLADNSATNGVQTLALSAGSVAIDAGHTTANGSVAIPGVDQRGGARNSSTDIGSFEYAAGGFDNTSPVISSIATTSATTTATITWETDEPASTKVNFGLTSSYGTSTAEKDISTWVTSHSASLTGLAACTRYHYQAESSDASGNIGTSTDDTFITIGCTNSAAISTTTTEEVATASGGSVTNGDLILTVPVSFTATSSSVTFQLNQIDETAFFTSVSLPSGFSRIGSSVFSLQAFTDATTTLSSFLSALTVTMQYTSADVDGIDETTLVIYRYDGSSWFALDNCVVDTGVRTVTCETNSFSDFALFGQVVASTGAVSSSSSGGSTVSRRIQNLKAMGNYALADELKRQYEVSAQLNTPAIQVTTSTSSIGFARASSTTASRIRDLYLGFEGDDVRSLQEFLIGKNLGAAARELARVGATGFFGPYTKNALGEYQKSNGIVPWAGYFGPITRARMQEAGASGLWW